jgi:uncharacterized SAM-binding protein YcdF (DUF218 family)
LFFHLKKVIAALILPPTGPLLLSFAGLVLLRWSRRAGTAFVWSGLIILFGLSLPVVSSALELMVCDPQPLDLRRARRAQGIVVLGGGLRRNAGEYRGDTPNRLTLERLRYAATLARETRLPVLVSGGRILGRRAEGDVMREVLEREYNVPVQWVENSSRNTHENASFSAGLLKAAAISRVLLVTHGVDSLRAKREFTAAGIEVISAPTLICGSPLEIETFRDLLPSMAALQDSYLALYELLGNAAMTLHLNGA